jgi:hypothetical protein
MIQFAEIKDAEVEKITTQKRIIASRKEAFSSCLQI